MKKKQKDNRRFPGLRVRCRKCGYEIQNIGEDGHKTDCKHPEEYRVYKAVLINPADGRRKSKNLDAATYEDAVQELLRFKAELENPIPVELLRQEESERPMGLAKCLDMYMKFLHGIGVPIYMKRERDKQYLHNMLFYSKRFTDFLKSKGIKTSTLRIDEVTEGTGSIVEQYYLDVKNKTKSPSTFNHHFRPLKGLYKFLIEKMDYDIINPFKNIPQLSEDTEPKAIEYADVEKIKSVISPAGDLLTFKNSTPKHMYREWLADAIDLALYTGVRREQLLVMKWSDVVCSPDGEPEYIRSNNLKVNRMLNRNGTKLDKYVKVPISMELCELLFRLGLEKKRGSDRYIIAPDEKIQREWMIRQMSKSFSFFRNKAGVSRDVSFKSLRKTYITRIDFLMRSGNVKAVTGHSDDAILKNHYIDGAQTAKAATATRFKLFEMQEIKQGLNPWPVHASAVDANQNE